MLLLFAAQVQGDVAELNPDAYDLVKSFADEYNIPIPKIDTSISKPVKKEENRFRDSQNPLDKFEDRTIFEKSTSFSQLVFTLRAKKLELRDKNLEDSSLVNAFGYRLLELLESGENQKAIHLLRYFSRIIDFNYKAASPLAEVGEGLERYGYKEEAAVAFSLAYARSRSGGGWLALGDEEQLFWVEHSLSLSRENGEQTLANELIYLLNERHHIWGITRHLIELCAKLRPDIAFDVWQAAFEVIQHRLPNNESDSAVIDSYTPKSIPEWTIDEAIVLLLLARVSHPELKRKVSALAGVAYAISNCPESVINPLIHFLTLNTSTTSVLLVLHILIESESEPYIITEALKNHLSALSRTDLFGFQLLSQILLARLGISKEMVSTDISRLNKSSDLSENKIEAVTSLDWNERVSNIQRVWSDFPRIVAERFDYIWENYETAKDFAKSHHKAAYSNLYRELPPTPFLFWEEEIFEYVLHEVLSSIYSNDNYDESEISFINNVIGSKILSNVHLHIANWYSRTTRPLIQIPSEQESSIEIIKPIAESDEFEDWYQCGYFERELIISESRTFEKFVTVMQGVEFQDSISSFSICPPFAETEGNNWWLDSTWEIDAKSFCGFIVGWRIEKDLLGTLPILVFHPALANILNLRPIKDWQSPLTLLDKNNEVCVRFRSWHMNKVGSSIGEENCKLKGCDLIVRPDIFENLTNLIGKHFRHIKLIT